MFRRKPKPENPWNEPILQGWTPTGPRIDLMALMVMLAKTQWDMNEDLIRMYTIFKWQSRIFAVCWIIVMVSTIMQIGISYRWW